MTLAPGTKLGPYEILAPLGAGGMGEVYRARDPRLGRDVAIKTLPAAFAGDPERRTRFETEARAIAALSHPNVLALFDVGTDGATTFAVMELVEGQTLRERLLDGPLTAARALGFAGQIASGLAAAHDRGVIHRDLKPENVILAADGRAKILDFGLARRAVAEGEGSRSLAPTMAAGTEPGVVLGTVGYMAPEQVRGLPADARSDIFALGAVMYEMLTGRRAFHGPSPADVMTAILREEPEDLARIATGTPPAVERIVRRCLEKQPAARFRSAADLAFALEAVAAAGSGSTHAAAAPALEPASSPLTFTRVTFRNGVVSGARFTPDGGGIVYGASWEGGPWEVFSSRPGSPDARSLGLPSANLLAMSVAGDMALSLGFHHRYWHQVTGTLARAALAGGGVRALQKDVGHADWGPDGRTMALIRYVEGRCRLEYPAGSVRFETASWLSRASVSRDGRHVAFAHHPLFGDSGGDIGVVDASGNHRVLFPGAVSISGIAWSPSGDEVWFSGINDRLHNGIWASRLDGARRELHSSPARISLHDAQPDGRLLISLGNLRVGMSVSGDDGAHDAELSWFDGSVATDLSADGRQVLFFESHEAENPRYACFLRDVDGSPAVRLGDGTSTQLSADEQWVLAVVHHPEGLWMYPTGLGEPRAISLPGIDRIVWAGFHPDGARLFVLGSSAERPRRLYLTPIAGGTPRLLWDEVVGCDRLLGPPITPDGGAVLVRRPSGEHVLVSCDTGAAQPLSGVGPEETALRFDPAGRYLYVSGGAAAERRVERLELAGGERRPWRVSRPPDPTGVVYVGNPIIADDGLRSASSYFRHIADLYVVEGLR